MSIFLVVMSIGVIIWAGFVISTEIYRYYKKSKTYKSSIGSLQNTIDIMKKKQSGEPIRICVSTADISGDDKLARLAGQIKATSNGKTEFSGIGGRRLRNAGVLISDKNYPITRYSGMGTDILSGILKWPEVIREFKKAVNGIKPDAMLLATSPALNFRIGRFAKRRNIPCFYYTPPDIWAWGAWRKKKVTKMSDLIIPTLPHEADIYRKTSGTVEYVGHPGLDYVHPSMNRETMLSRMGIGDGCQRIIGLFPGSKKHEIERILPCMVDSAIRISLRENVKFGLGLAEPYLEEPIKNIIKERQTAAAHIDDIYIEKDFPFDLMNVSDLLLVTSGSVTLEAAIIGTPMIILYKTSSLNALLAKWLLKIPYIGLPNIVAGRKILPELYQGDVNAEDITDHALNLLSKERNEEIRSSFEKEVIPKLGEKGGLERAAKMILDHLGYS